MLDAFYSRGHWVHARLITTYFANDYDIPVLPGTWHRLHSCHNPGPSLYPIHEKPCWTDRVGDAVILLWGNRIWLYFNCHSDLSLFFLNRPSTHVEVITEANGNFFDDSLVASMLSTPTSPPSIPKSSYRMAVVKRYLQEINQSVFVLVQFRPVIAFH